MSTCMRACVRMYVRTYIHTYMYTYTQTDIQTYIHRHVFVCANVMYTASKAYLIHGLSLIVCLYLTYSYIFATYRLYTILAHIYTHI